MPGDIPEQTHHTSLDQKRPGAALKLLRQQRDIELAAIAEETHIPIGKLSALEDDQYDRLGGSTFVVGYLRKYAKWLGVDSDPLVAAYSGQEAEADAPIPLASPVSGQAAQGAGPVQKVARAIKNTHGGLVVGGIMVLWGLAVLFLDGSDTPQTDEAVSAAVEIAEPPAPQTVEALEPLEVLDLPGPGVAQVETVEPAGSGAALAGGGTPEPVASEPESDGQQAVTTQTAAPEQDLLSIILSDECWVKVTDASGEVLFAQLQAKGDNLQLFGEAPFDVMLGNARAVDMLINGNPVAVNPIPNRKTLRLRVQP